MTKQHPLTPPPELVGEWLTESADLHLLIPSNLDYLATRAAQWGWDQREPEIQAAADAELEACCDAIYLHEDQPLHGGTAEWLRAARRPKPPSLKEQALKELQMAYDTSDISVVHLDTIRRALEALSDD